MVRAALLKHISNVPLAPSAKREVRYQCRAAAHQSQAYQTPAPPVTLIARHRYHHPYVTPARCRARIQSLHPPLCCCHRVATMGRLVGVKHTFNVLLPVIVHWAVPRRCLAVACRSLRLPTPAPRLAAIARRPLGTTALLVSM
jgi:hypothetical protein